MQFPTRFRNRLAKGKIAGGMFLNVKDPASAEMLAHRCELDWVALDLQHAPISPDDATGLLRAVQAVDPTISPMVRLPGDDKYWIQQSLDAGFIGLIVPGVESAQQIRQVATAAYFPPVGQRSFAGSIRGSLYTDYFKRINDEVILLPQIESIGGLEHLEQIVAEPGVSGVLLGPGDLSMSYGWPMDSSQWSHEPLLEACRHVVETCRQQNKCPSILVGTDEAVRHAQRLGFQAIGVAGDNVLVRTVAADQINRRLQYLEDKKDT